MGLLQQFFPFVSAPRLRAESSIQQYTNAFWAGNDLPALPLSSNTADLALTLSHVYGAVSIIADDFGSMSCQLFEDLGDTPQGQPQKRRVGYGDLGVGDLARKLRWAPNAYQTAKAFWTTLAWQTQLRSAAYAEILWGSGTRANMIDQIIPRHPDRVREETLAGGRLRYRLIEPNGQTRYVLDEDMFVVRHASLDGLNALSRLDYGGRALSAAFSLQEFTRNYFAKGATASLVGTYKGPAMEDEQEAALHKSITRYVSGADNAGGVLLVPEDIEIKPLSVEPEKAQLLGLKNLSGRDVARLFKLPPSWLGIEGASAYNSYIQDCQTYVNRVQIPLAVEVEQTIHSKLLVAPRFFAKFNFDYLLRADTLARFQAYEIAIRSRVMRPSECRVKEDLNPDPALDALSEADHRPGTPRTTGSSTARALRIAESAARRVVRRETAAIATAARKHASDAEGFARWAETFYAGHVEFVAEALAMPDEDARAYCAGQARRLGTRGLAETETWEQDLPPWLARQALATAETLPEAA